MKHLKFCIFFILINSSNLTAQSTYTYPNKESKQRFYASLKVPLIDYVSYLFDNNRTENFISDGALIDFGYIAVKKQSFSIEAGIEYFIINPFYYEFTDKNSLLNRTHELNVKNSAISIQARPSIDFSLDENISLRLNTALGYRKLFSDARLYEYQNVNNKEKLILVENQSSESDFISMIQPSVGIDYHFNKLIIGFELSYIMLNWSKSMKNLNFKSYDKLYIPPHKTSDIFFSCRFTL